ncbi:hypothetical protein [Flavobacterium phage V157]|uniref:Uncharacterized protein n=12 Tax=Ficleduovirus FCV1 TaxID=2560474 RepID=A0A218M8E2_9CAUD|nr:hypothetical protein FDG55_gp56 [Flavobacterium phage FCV-1]ASD51638.1 hypothetical protein [Flavobacterium phage FCV-3]ASD51712.1 hypothetical protein [Flavobacterium phage FCV-11]ASD51786.1 hypothetical protein [Flavobacterium phage V175]ASD51864.1 hypothetical protein [Flavobacterium phage V181]ASD52542.1 hypothetical protein [Flavobacterium phage FCV-10]ASD52615.1 hypothetical protein [Flavobacterium phage FCV-16]ASD52689.1 hypothetical protein [Flavobacterium phage FCV-20]ASD52762.1
MSKLSEKIENKVTLQMIMDSAKERSLKLPEKYDSFSYELGFNQAYHFILSELMKSK